MMFDDETPHGCMFCTHSIFVDPVPDADGNLVYGFGTQPVQCALFGIVDERRKCDDEDVQPIQYIQMEDLT